MAEFGTTVAALMSIIIGMILSLLFDGIFIAIVIGFLAVYLVEKKEKKASLGAICAAIFASFNFIIKFLESAAIAPIPVELQPYITLDPFNLVWGFILLICISGLLGYIGGIFAQTTSKETDKVKYKEIR